MGDRKGARKRPPGATQKTVEDEMVNLAMELARKKMKDGSASPQIVVHFLRLGSLLAQVELKKAENETLLLEAKARAIDSSRDNNSLYLQAINAMRKYTGESDPTDEDV